MEQTIYVVRFKLLGYTHHRVYIARCITSSYALSECLQLVLKSVDNPIIESVTIEEVEEECEPLF